MDRFRELALFNAVAEEGAFNAAARRLNVSPPAVTRAIASLEERLGVTLFIRSTRRVALTDAGVRFHADAVRILNDLAEAEGSVAGEHLAPRGELRLTAPVLFGQCYVAPILRKFLDTYPQMTASALFSDRNVDLIEEGLDVAVRIGTLADSSLVAVRAGEVRRVVVAHPRFFADSAVPSNPSELASHRIIFAFAGSDLPVWEFDGPRGRAAVRVRPTLRVNTMTAAIDAALDGWGLTRALSYQVAEHLAAGRLIEVGYGWDATRLPVSLLHSEGRRASAKIRAFVDLAKTALSAVRARLLAA